MVFQNHMKHTSHIIATGSYLPKRVVTNNELATLMATSDAWIRTNIGICERRFAVSGEGASDMAFKASKRALIQAKLKAKDIDAIIFATTTPEYHAPGSGVLLQHKLGCRNIPAFDVRNTSPGFVYSLDMADGLIKSGRYKTVLIAASEVHSTGLDFSNQGRKMAVIFGDGAGAVIVRAGAKTGHKISDVILHSDGRYFDKLWCEGPKHPNMDGHTVVKHATKNMTAAVTEILKKNKLKVSDIDWFLFHQANKNIIATVGKNLKLPAAKVPTNIEKYGNTSSASIPILLDELTRAGKIKNNQKIIMTSFGSGFCWGAILISPKL